jgi:hypothetical protein
VTSGINGPAWANRRISRSVGLAGLRLPIEIVGLKCFEMLSEGVVHTGKRVENGSDPRA